MTTTAAPDASPTAPTAAVSQHADAKATRQAAPPLPQGTLAVEAPPDLVQPEGGLSGLMMAMPAVGSVGSVAMIAFGSQGSASAMRYVFAGCILLASLGFVAAMVTRNRARHVRAVTRSRQGISSTSTRCAGRCGGRAPHSRNTPRGTFPPPPRSA